ncbi:MAG TPA: RluA family pseudouridine synthase [Candidatus Paceibacterota bacterium]|jgi:23S rRNA pseudouridine1911/1915/1917 synthase|nr:RluA family pseudouridine synthase [Candidatus Paceibacterota bacterium]
MDFPILYEDADLLAIDKPAGVMTHPDGHSAEETVSDWFAKKYPASKEVGETQRLQNGAEILRPGIVHRLDRDTSGVLVLAKTPEAHAFLKAAFQEHTVQKTYLAFVYGVPKEEKGTINLPIGRSSKDFRLRSAQRGSRGLRRDAITHYQVIGDIGTHALLKAMPETGRTHQIRVHLKAIHHPIVCDPLYAPNHPCDLSFNRLGLHAYQLELPLLNGERTTITSPIPAELKPAIAKFPNTEDFLVRS